MKAGKEVRGRFWDTIQKAEVQSPGNIFCKDLSTQQLTWPYTFFLLQFISMVVQLRILLFSYCTQCKWIEKKKMLCCSKFPPVKFQGDFLMRCINCIEYTSSNSSLCTKNILPLYLLQGYSQLKYLRELKCVKVLFSFGLVHLWQKKCVGGRRNA